MKRFGLLVALVGMLSLICFFVSCDSEMSNVPKYSTPTITGRITVPSSSGLSPEKIWLKVTDGNDTKYVGNVKDDGSFEISGLEEGQKYSILFSSNQPDYVNASRNYTPTTSRSSDTGYGGWLTNVTAVIDEGNDIGSVKMKPLGTIKGVAQLSDSDEHYDTMVYIPGSSFMAITDADGNFSITSVPQGTHTLRYTAAGYVSVMKENTLLHSDSETENPVLIVTDVSLIKAVGEVRGFALISGVAEHTGITIKLENENNAAEGTTSPDGSFHINDIIPGTYRVIASYPGHLDYIQENVEIVNGTITKLDDIVLRANGGKITGLIKLNDSYGAEGVLILAQSSDEKYSYVSSTNASGEYNLDNCHPGKYEITFSKAGYSTYTEKDVSVRAGTHTVVNEVTLPSITGKISGKVTLSNTEDSSGVTILLKGEKHFQATTASDGTYHFNGIDVGYYTAEIRKTGYSPQTLEDVYVESGKTTLLDNITLIYSSSSINGRVVLEGIANNTGATVTAISTVDNSIRFSTTTSEDGTYHFTTVPAGEYTIEVQAQGFLTDRSQKIIVDVGTTKVVDTITLLSITSTVKGTVTLEGAANHTGTSILLLATDGRDDSYSTTTEQNGKFTLTRVNPGLYDLYASHEGYQTLQQSAVAVESTTIKTLDAQQLEIAIKSMTGTVVLELKDDHAGALVTATNLQNEQLVYSAITNSSGTFSLAGMQSGEYLVTISNSGYNTLTLPTINTTTTVVDLGTLNLAISRGKISGQITLEGWTHHEGIAVALVDTDYTATTDSDGLFEFNVPTGNYPGGLVLSKTDFETKYLTDTLTVISGSTFAIKDKDVTLKATHTTVRGVFEIKGMVDHSGVEVLLGNNTTTTGIDGSWSFEHIALNTYSLEARYENVPDYYSSISVTPREEINIGTIILIPETASIQGFARLTDMNNSAGVLVSVTTSTLPGEKIKTLTDANGWYYLSGLSTADDAEHTITYSKDGWDSQEQKISGLTPLEERELSTLSLVDTTVPVFNKVLINNGTLVTSNTTVTISIDASDAGSGIEQMKVTWLDDFSASSWEPYYPSFDSEIVHKNINELNGTKTVQVYLKDKAGNETAVLNASIELTNQIKTIDGMLSDSELHWTEGDPYAVSGDIIVPTGKELIIDPGVQVYFLGNYGISVRGKITAIGTKEKPIRFEPAGDNLEGHNYHGMWEGINGSSALDVRNDKFNFILIEGSILEHVIINDAGIAGNIFLKDSEITTDGWALGGNSNFIGYAVGNTIIGNVSIDYATLFNNKLKGYYPEVQASRDFYAIDCNYLWNNLIENYYFVDFGWNNYSISNNTFNNCGSLYVSHYFYPSYLMSANVISNITNPINLDASRWNASFNNIVTEIASPLIKVTRGYTNGDYDWTNNYWGESRTRELENIVNSSTSQKSPSFIYDGFDDYSLASVDWSNFAKEPWGFAGYQGDDYVTISATLVRPSSNYNEPLYGEPVQFAITEKTQISIAEYRIAQTMEQLLISNWKSFTGTAKIEEIDESFVKDGVATVYIQGRSAQGTETPIETVTFGYDLPEITYCTISEGDVITSDADLNIAVRYKDYTGGGRVEVYLNGENLRTYSSSLSNTTSYTIYTSPYTELLNGDYQLDLVPIDRVGNVGEIYTANFTVDRPLPYVSDLSLTEGTEVGEGEALPVELTIKNAKHLKQVRLLANSVEMYSKSFNDKDNGVQTIETSIESAYLPNGSNEFIVEMVDFAGNVTRSDSIEFTVSGSPIPPAIKTFALDEGFVYTGDSFVTVTVKAEDIGGVKDIRLYMIDEDGVEEEIFTLPYNRYSPGTVERTEKISLMLGYMKNGAYKVRVEAEDFAGNISTESRNITINRPPIIISMTKYTESPYFRYYVTSSSANNRRFYVYLDGVPYGYSTSSDKNFYFYYEELAVGEHTVEVVLYDQAGNISTASDTFTVEGEVSDSSQYGKGVSWTDGGSLLADYATEYLWTFENESIPGKEEVYGLIDLRVDEIVEGIGQAAKVYVNTPTDFISSSWTVEYWVKGREDNSELKLTGLIRSYGYDSRSSYYYNRIDYPYKNIATNENTSTDLIKNLYDPDIQERWHHVAIVSAGSELCYYVDGIMRYKHEGAIQLSREATNLYINGIFDEIRISNKARSKDEIWSYYDYVVKNNLINQ